MKRIFLFLVLNFAVMIALMVAFHIVCALLGIDPNAAFATSGGLDLKATALQADGKMVRGSADD